MIKSKVDYLEYLNADKIALGVRENAALPWWMKWIFPNPTWNFQKKLRQLEYFYNCKSNILQKRFYYYLEYRFQRLSIRLGFSIPKNVFGPGLAIMHYGTIVVNANARIGKNCRIHPCTNIGASGGKPEAPQIGDNCYIGPGAKIFGNIKIGNGVAIGSNATVNKSFEENNILIVGSPARKIKEIDISKIIKHVPSRSC